VCVRLRPSPSLSRLRSRDDTNGSSTRRYALWLAGLSFCSNLCCSIPRVCLPPGLLTSHSPLSVHERRPCVVVIPPGEIEHDGTPHTHDIGQAFHYCTTTFVACIITRPSSDISWLGARTAATTANSHTVGVSVRFAFVLMLTSSLGHPQTEHETSHGSMSKTRWAIDGDTAVIQVQGRKFGANDDGAPMLVRLVSLPWVLIIDPKPVLPGVQGHGPSRARRLLSVRRPGHVCSCRPRALRD
jgi:hypothetical protein